MTVATPKHAECRPFGAARIIVGVLSGLLSLALKFVVVLVAVFRSASALMITGVELAPAALLGVVVARRRDSRRANVALAVCVGIAVGLIPYLLRLVVGAVLVQ